MPLQLLFVGKIDGSVSAVDGNNGNILWTFQTGSPLIATQKETDSNVQVFPGIDGSIFVLHGDESPKLEVKNSHDTFLFIFVLLDESCHRFRACGKLSIVG